MLTDYRTDLTHNADAFEQQENEVTAMDEPETDDPEVNEAPLFQGLGQLSLRYCLILK